MAIAPLTPSGRSELPASSGATAAPAVAAPPRILMVDDRPDALLALEAVLEPLGAQLVAARSGLEALQQLLAGDFAVIILDVQMPEMDGFETARLIRQRERCRHVPIVFLTAISGEPQHFMAGYEAGGFDYLYKPYDPALLRAKIGVLLRLWEKDRQIEQQHLELAEQHDKLKAAYATAQHQSEELARSNAALERVAEVAAAGLRRPLCLAEGFLQLSLAGHARRKQRHGRQGRSVRTAGESRNARRVPGRPGASHPPCLCRHGRPRGTRPRAGGIAQGEVPTIAVRDLGAARCGRLSGRATLVAR